MSTAASRPPSAPADATTGRPAVTEGAPRATPVQAPCTRDTSAERRLKGHALLAALGAGLLGDLLLRGAPLGLNLLVWTVVALAVAFALARRQGRPVTVAAGLLAVLALLFAACVAWRDARTLTGLALFGLATAVCALARALRDGSAWAFERAETVAYVAGLWGVAWDVATGARTLGGERAALHEWSQARTSVRAFAVAARGVLVATPVLAVFGLLLSAADGAFARLVARALSVDLTAAAGHVAWTAAGAWAVAGYLAGALFSDRLDGTPAALSAVARGWRLRVGAAEVCVALALVDALLLAFVVVQLGRLLDGHVVGGGSGFPYAEYARRGFFELVTVVALALPLLVMANAVVAGAPHTASIRRAYRAAAGILVVLLGVLAVSAADRMRLYQMAYGLTELRVYVSASLAWLAVMLVWAAATLLRGRTAAFALGGTLLGWLWIFGLHALDPAALVVRVNAARAAVPSSAVPWSSPDDPALDVTYLASLGADAVPGLVAHVLPQAMSTLEPEVRCAALGVLEAAIAHPMMWEPGGWRGWNLARWRAARAARGIDRGASSAWCDRCAPLEGIARPPAPGVPSLGGE